MPENMRRTLAAWGYEFAEEASHEPKQYKPVDCTRDLQQVRELLRDPSITALMLIQHPHIQLTKDARTYLEGLQHPDEQV